MSEEVSQPRLPSSDSFDVRPYRPDGGFSLSGLVILTLVTCLAGALSGLLAGFIGHYFFVIVLYPIVMGFVIGAAGAFGVRAGRVRMPVVCGTAGLLGGCVAVLAMHGVAYYMFEDQWKNVPPEIRQVARNLPQARANLKAFPADIQDAINKLAKDEETRRALAVDGLASFIDYRAHQGVEIGRMVRRRRPTNLGYVGSYVYWGVELLLIAGLAFVVMQGAAAEPYCARCDNWKTAVPAGTFYGATKGVREALESGDPAAIMPHVEVTGTKMKASIFTCRQCEGQAEIDVRIEWVTIDDKGEESPSTLCTVTYPGESLGLVREVFAAASTASEQPFARPADDPVDEDMPDGDEQRSA